MKLPRTLLGLAGPSTPEFQKSYLKDLKTAFRHRIDHIAAPIGSTLDNHFQSILRPSSCSRSAKMPRSLPTDTIATARSLYYEGLLDKQALHTLIGQTTTKCELTAVRDYSIKAGSDLAYSSTDLSARYAAKLLQFGQFAEVESMMTRYAKRWLATRIAHPLLVNFASQKKGMSEALDIFGRLLAIDPQNMSTPLVRALLRESVRHSDMRIVKYCLEIDIKAAQGKETGLARWLDQQGDPSLAFTVLVRAEPSMAAEAAVGLKIASSLIQNRDTTEAKKVLRWVESRYALSVQDDLRQVRGALMQFDGTKKTEETQEEAAQIVCS